MILSKDISNCIAVFRLSFLNCDAAESPQGIISKNVRSFFNYKTLYI